MIKTVFATQLYHDRLATPKVTQTLNRQLLREAYTYRDLDADGRSWSKTNYVGGYTSYASLTDVHLRSPHFAELQTRIDTHVKRYARSLGMDLQGGSLHMSTCWINIMPTGTHHSGHVHPLSVISGTYYVAVPKGAGGIKFEDPRLPLMMASPPKRIPTPETLNPIIEFAPEAGKIVLFESWLRHEVPANRAKSDRVSISFNYEWT